MLKNIKYFIEQSWLLMAAAFFFGLLLAVTNAAWHDRIVQNEIDKFDNLAKGMFTGPVQFGAVDEKFEVDTGRGKMKEVEIKKVCVGDKCLGWAFVCEGSGFADKIRLVVAVDAGFEKLKGYGVLSSNETPGFGDKIKNNYFRDQFVAAPATALGLSKTGDDKKIDSEIIAITGATVSSEAVVTIINNFIGQIGRQMQAKGLIDNGS